MDSFRIEWRQSAIRELKKIETSAIPHIIEAVKALADNPHPPGSKKLRGSKQAYRVRVGDYRVVYSIHSDALVIEVIRVGHRRNVYRRLS